MASPREQQGSPARSSTVSASPGPIEKILSHPLASVLLYLLLIDLAVETYLNDAPVWGWVAGAVVLYLAVSAYLWNRIRWSTKAALSALLLVTLLAVTVWRPGGLDRGVSFLGQPTPVLLATLTGLAVAFAALLLLRLEALPRWAGWAGAALGTYGLAAFALAATTRTPYADLFHGASLWSRLPIWLQGAVLASVVLIPAGLVALLWSSVGEKTVRSPWSTAVFALPLVAAVSFAGAALTAPQVRALGISTSEDGRERVSEVPTYVSSLFAGWEVAGIDSETTVEGRWVKLTADTGDVATRGAGFVEVIRGDTGMTSAVSSPEDGWRPGRYRLDLRVGSRALRSVEFVVKPPETRVVLASTLDDAGEPVDPGHEFLDDVAEIHAVVHSELAGATRFVASWVAVDTEDREPNRRVERDRFYLQPGEREIISLEAPESGFFPGDYKLDLESSDAPDVTVPFRIESVLPIARLMEEVRPPLGLNVALAAVGGRITTPASEDEDSLWSASNLIDGVPIRVEVGGSDCVSCGWSTGDDSLPREIVLSLPGNRAPRVSAVVLDPTTAGTIERPEEIPRHVEVWVSATSADSGFQKVGGARIRRVLGEQVIRFSPVRARYLKVRLLSNYGGRRAQVGEVKVIEDPGDEPSILEGRRLNLALPALGGTVVTYTSQRDEGVGVHRLIDGRTETPGWRSADGYLPQEFVFALDRPELPQLDEVVVRPAGDHDPSTRPTLISVSVSTEGPFEGFEEVGSLVLSRDAGADSLEVGLPARFVKLRILETFGGDYTALDEIELLENVQRRAASGRADARSPAAGTGADQPADAPSADEREVEPNDTPGEANALSLDRTTEGVIEAPGQEDYFHLQLPGDDLSVLTLDLAGIPNIRTSVGFVAPDGATLKRFDPGGVAARRTAFSWAVPGGEHLLRVSQPPTSIVLIWDASGSMEGKSEDLRRAVEAYISQVEPSERVNLMRFSAGTDVLLPSFTSDREQLRRATEDQFNPFGGTALFDAVDEGLRLLEEESGNKAIVVMTDGNDTSSRIDAPEFWQGLETAGVRLYTIGLGSWLRAYVPAHASSGEQLLAHAARGTNGRFFFARNSEQLGSVYEQIAEELRSASTYYLRPSVAPGAGGIRVIATEERIPREVTAPPQVELIFDASGSMRERDNLVDGQLKIDVAKDVVERIVTELPEDVQVGLRVYGHRIPEGRPGDCEDSELVYPFGELDKDRLIRRVREIRARAGTTPIAYSLRQVAGDFGDTEGEKIVILVTDGREECGGNVTEAASALLDQGLRVRVNVVGFALADETVKEEMERVAALTRGRFYDAQDSEALLGAIEESLAVPYDVLTADSTVVGSGLVGQGSVEVPAGVYTVVVHAAGSPITIPNVRVRHDQSTTIELRKEGQEVGVIRRGAN